MALKKPENMSDEEIDKEIEILEDRLLDLWTQTGNSLTFEKALARQDKLVKERVARKKSDVYGDLAERRCYFV